MPGRGAIAQSEGRWWDGGCGWIARDLLNTALRGPQNRGKVREFLRGGCYWMGAECRLEAQGQAEGASSKDGVVPTIYLWIMVDEPAASKNQLGLSFLHDEEGHLF